MLWDHSGLSVCHEYGKYALQFENNESNGGNELVSEDNDLLEDPFRKLAVEVAVVWVTVGCYVSFSRATSMLLW